MDTTPELNARGRGNGETEGPSEWLTCALCGERFREAGHTACSACPLNLGCEVTCCPRCGYSSPRRSRVVEFFRRLGRRWGGSR